jgi:hypothetical protein
MADQRKTFRPRLLVLGASFLLAGAFVPALAEDAGLKNGAAALDAGKYDNAVRMLSSTVNSETASPEDAAKALYLRGIAYRKLGQSGHAISDLGAAIFLGLPDQDRIKALVNRGLAYQAAGLSSQGDAEIAQARRAGGSGVVDQLIAEGGGPAGGATSIASASSGTSGQWTTTGSSATGEGGNRVSRWWGSLTGSSSTEPSATAEGTAPPKTPTAPSTGWGAQTQGGDVAVANTPPRAPNTGWGAQTQGGDVVVGANTPPRAPSSGWGAQTQASSAPVPASPPPAPSSPPRAPSTGWGAQTQGGNATVASDASPSQSRWSRWFSRTAEADQAVPPQPPATGGRGGFQLQLANSRSEGEAQALWKQVSGANATLAGKSPEIEKVDIGNFGTFYSLKAGPFPDKAESTKVCNALKRSGVDCLVVSPDAQ